MTRQCAAYDKLEGPGHTRVALEPLGSDALDTSISFSLPLGGDDVEAVCGAPDMSCSVQKQSSLNDNMI